MTEQTAIKIMELVWQLTEADAPPSEAIKQISLILEAYGGYRVLQAILNQKHYPKESENEPCKPYLSIS